MNSPYGTRHQLTRADQIEIHRQWVDTQRAIDAYWTQPTITGAYCETCARQSPADPCWRCCGHGATHQYTRRYQGRDRRVCRICDRERSTATRARKKNAA